MHDERQALLISIQPRFADLILSGAKSVELRRVRPRVSNGDLILLYASSPIRELVGVCTVAHVDIAPTSELWRRHGQNSGLQRAEFDSYFKGAARSVAISLQDAQRIIEPRTLTELRKRLPGFVAPQSYRYISPESLRQLEIVTEDGALLEESPGALSARS